MASGFDIKSAARWASVVFLSIAVGVIAMKKRIPPLPQLDRVYWYLTGVERLKPVTPWERIQNDTGRYPYRFLYDRKYKAPGSRPFQEVALRGPRPRRLAPLVYLNRERREPGLTLISAVLDTEASLQGVLLLGENGEPMHQWPLTQNFAEWEHRPDTNVYFHGFVVFPDGSLISAINEGNTLARIDFCGNPIWVKKIGTHHSVTVDGPDHVWTWDYANMIRIRISDGEIVQRLSLEDVIQANPETDVLAVRQRDYHDGSVWDKDPLHANDVDPLPPALADAFPMFEAGDLVISLRSLNLLVVVDPESAKIKWWRQGIARRQHDPDWQADGTITYYDNNTNRGKSRIRSIAPTDFTVRDILDGNDYDFYSDRQGTHQRRPGGSQLITSTHQGRVFEVAPDGKVVFEFVNRYDSEHVAYVGDALTVAPDFFEDTPKCD